jgi:hypothetical protein
MNTLAPTSVKSLQSKRAQKTANANRFMKKVQVAPRAVSLTSRFSGNVREGRLDDLLRSLWTSLQSHLADPVRVKETASRRTVTFMGAVRFSVDKASGRVSVCELATQKSGRLGFLKDEKPTVIDLACRLDGFWLDPFLLSWRPEIAECLIDHTRASDGPDWMESIRRELRRAIARSSDWFRIRCALRDALKLDSQVVQWCRKGRPTYRDYVTHVQYNNVLADRATYQSIQEDNPNLVWLYNYLRAEKVHPRGSQPVAGMKAWVLHQDGVSEAGWRLIANSKEQDFRHLIDFVDADGGILGRHTYLSKWVRLLGKLRRRHAVPRPLLGLFVHDIYDAEDGDHVRFRDVVLQTGTLRAILDEGERRLANGSHEGFIREDVVEVMTWLETERPVLTKTQLRQGWKYLATRAARWKVEIEAFGLLSALSWDSLLPETQVGQWRVVPLTDAWQLRREALSQRHCADQHINECLADNYRHFSVRNAHGKPVATIGIEKDGMTWKVFGFREFANRPVRGALRGLDVEVAQRYSDLWQLKTSGELPPLTPVQELGLDLKGDSPIVKITRLRIGPLDSAVDEERNYWAEAIEYEGKFFYRAAGTTIEIKDYQFRAVIENPKLYYFSTALMLHLEIKRIKAG